MNELSLHIIDIIQNSLSAGANLIQLTINENTVEDRLSIVIEDNGKGIDQDKLEKIFDPFFTSRTTRKVGLGIPLFKQSANQSGGDLIIESQVGKGTKLTATFVNSHIDRPPMGDIANSFILMVSSNPKIEFILKYHYNQNEYEFNTVEVKEVLEDTPLNDASIIRMLTDMVRENILDLKL